MAEDLEPGSGDEAGRGLTTSEDNRAALIEMLSRATRDLAIFSRHLDSRVYDDAEVLEGISQLATRSPFSCIRILVMDGRQAISRGSQLVELARRLSSFIEVRRVYSDFQQMADEFVIGDQTALIYRPLAERYEGAYFASDGMRARERLRVFDRIWEKSEPDPELRRLGI